jgi:hypothetical protein
MPVSVTLDPIKSGSALTKDYSYFYLVDGASIYGRAWARNADVDLLLCGTTTYSVSAVPPANCQAFATITIGGSVDVYANVSYHGLASLDFLSSYLGNAAGQLQESLCGSATPIVSVAAADSTKPVTVTLGGKTSTIPVKVKGKADSDIVALKPCVMTVPLGAGGVTFVVTSTAKIQAFTDAASDNGYAEARVDITPTVSVKVFFVCQPQTTAAPKSLVIPGTSTMTVAVPPGTGICYAGRDCQGRQLDSGVTYQECWEDERAKSWKDASGNCHTFR